MEKTKFKENDIVWMIVENKVMKGTVVFIDTDDWEELSLTNPLQP